MQAAPEQRECVLPEALPGVVDSNRQVTPSKISPVSRDTSENRFIDSHFSSGRPGPREAPHPSSIRSVPQLYNIFDHRSEGLATGVEEMFMHLGLLDDNSPRARELVWIMLAQRAARATSGLMLHGNEFVMEEAVEFAGKWTPRGWLPDGDLVRWEMTGETDPILEVDGVQEAPWR